MSHHTEEKDPFHVNLVLLLLAIAAAVWGFIVCTSPADGPALPASPLRQRGRAGGP